MSEDTSTTSGPAPYPEWQPPYPAQQQYVAPPALPSRVPTVLITVFFGVFGAIPAYLHGKRAEELGGSSNRYWAAFGITLAASLLAWVAILVGLAAVLFTASTSVDQGLPVSVQAQ